MTLLANAQIVLPHETIRGSLRIENGRITAIDAGATQVAQAIDCQGDYLIPGLIELHTDNLERHLQPRPKVDWPHRAAILAHDAELAGAGITTVFDALRVGSIISNSSTNYGEYARQLASEILQLSRDGSLRISHKLHLRAEVCSETLVEELAKFAPEDQIGIISLMDHTPGQRQFRDINQLRSYVRGKHGLNEEQFLAHIASQQALGDRVREVHVAAILAAASRLGAVLASHDDTTREQVEISSQQGAQVAEFPTTFEAAETCRATEVAVMMGAPNLIRGGSHSGNVAAADLAAAGLLDILSSDYVPASLLQGAMILADLWGDLPRGVATVTSAPAAATGLADRGQIALGLRGDIVRLRRVEGGVALRGTWVAGERVG